MKTNNLLTYILYALLLGLIAIAGYKACELKKEKALRAKEDAAIQQTLDNLAADDDSDSTELASTYKDGSDEKATQTTVPAPTGSGKPETSASKSSSGIEGDDTATGRTSEKPVTSSVPSKKPLATTPADTDTDEESASAQPAKSKKSVSSGGAASGGGRYWVVAGAFKVMDGAREEMEKLVKLGFKDAAAVKASKGGTYGYAVAKRTNSKSEADAVLAKLKKLPGYSAAYVKDTK